jgi:peroxiredoxin
MEVKVGSPAPDFTLSSHADQKLSLASFRGRRTVVSFLPFAFTGG